MSKEEKTEKNKNVPAIVEKGTAIKPKRRVPPSNFMATFDNLLDDFRRNFMESIWTPWEWARERPWMPWSWTAIEPYTEFPIREAYSDLVDEGNKFLVHTEVPGIPKDKLDVTVTKNGIEISGEASAKSEEKDKNYVVRERSYSRVYKNLAFPEEVIPEKAECIVKDGVLEVSIPKKTPTPEAKKHKIEVKEAK